jgi:hypothetical protein
MKPHEMGLAKVESGKVDNYTETFAWLKSFKLTVLPPCEYNVPAYRLARQPLNFLFEFTGWNSTAGLTICGAL